MTKREYDRLYYQKNKAKKDHAAKKWRVENPEKWNEYSRKSVIKYREKLRLEVLIYYSKGEPTCACCGERQVEFLVLDHIDGKGNEHRESLSGNYRGSNFYIWVRKNNFPPLFQVLCHNCNFGKIKNGICPHKQV